tara:strand:- start:191899 stop:192174 length:276 start_codon:yes stop_codon:yes gene_type:complete
MACCPKGDSKIAARLQTSSQDNRNKYHQAPSKKEDCHKDILYRRRSVRKQPLTTRELIGAGWGSLQLDACCQDTSPPSSLFKGRKNNTQLS